MSRTVLFSTMKNEAPFLLEWVAYHRVIGFEEIVVCTHGGEDATEQLLAALAAAGEVTHLRIEVAPGEAPQVSAVRRVHAGDILRPSDWALFLDADEFLNIHVGQGGLADLTARIAPAPGMLINWRIFGDSGQQRFPGRYVSKAFPGCAEQPDKVQFKTLFQVSETVTGFSEHLHLCRVVPDQWTPGDFLNSRGAPLSSRGQYRAWLREGDHGKGHLHEADIGYELAQINHYMVRDPVSFRLKQRRGRGFKAAGKRNSRHTEAFYAAHNFNVCSDLSIARWEESVSREMARLLEVSGLAPLQEEVWSTYLAEAERQQLAS